MGVFVFAITVLGVFLVYKYTVKALKNVDIDEKMDKIKTTEKRYAKVVDFKKDHNGYDRKKKEVDKFIK